MTKHYKWNVKTFISNLITLLGVLFVLWAVISYFEIVIKNVNPNPEYFKTNLFILLTEMMR